MAAHDQAFEMPKPYLGEAVNFWPNGNKTGEMSVAIVTRINPRSVTLRNISAISFRDGVRHTDDPMLNLGEQAANGSWDFSDYGKEFRKMQAALADKRKAQA